MRIMALDVGEKTIGIAVSDLLGYTAQGLDTILRKDIDNDIKQIQDLIGKYEVSEIIVGFPRNMNGTIGRKAEEIEKFIASLKETIDLDVKKWDERLTTAAGEKVLLQANMSRKKRKKVIDKIAACLILQNYLDRRKNV